MAAEKRHVAMHLEGCPCGSGAIPMTPTQFLTKCYLKRYEMASKEKKSFQRTIPINENTLGSELYAEWDKLGLLPDGPRVPLICRHSQREYSGKREGSTEVTRVGFHTFRTDFPFDKGQSGDENQAGRIQRGINSGKNVYTHFAHWPGETSTCPCGKEAINYTEYFNDDEREVTRESLYEYTQESGTVLLKGTTHWDKTTKRRVLTQNQDFRLDDEIQLWIRSNRPYHGQIVYDQLISFRDPQRVQLPFGKLGVILIPKSKIEQFKKILLRNKDEGEPDYRSRGKLSYNFNETFLTIYVKNVSSLTRVLNAIYRYLSKDETKKFATKSSINIEALDGEGNLLQSKEGLENSFEIKSDKVGVYISKRSGSRLDKLGITRVSIDSDNNFSFHSSSGLINEKSIEIIEEAESYSIYLTIGNIIAGQIRIRVTELSTDARDVERSFSEIVLEASK